MSEPKVTKQDILNASSQMLNKNLYVIFFSYECEKIIHLFQNNLNLQQINKVPICNL